MKHKQFHYSRNVLISIACWAYIAARIYCDSREQSGALHTKAYLDPSTGAMIVSAIIGVFATIALGGKTIWYKIRSLFRKKQAPKADASLSEPQDK
jgi:hypothetical protein